MKQVSEKRAATAKAVRRAAEAWKNAPAGIKAMAGTWVAPLLDVFAAIDDELQEIEDGND